MAEENTNDQQAQPTDGPQFGIQRVYVNDLSVECPSSPQIFLEEWSPEINLDLDTKSNKLDNDTYEVVLKVTVTAKVGEKTAFLAEVKQAGIFALQGFSEDQLEHTLAAFCPNILYPYAREAITCSVVRAGFPQLYLAPVNFDALYEQHKQSGKTQ